MSYLDFTKIDNYNNSLRIVLDRILCDSKVDKKCINSFDFNNRPLNEFLEEHKLNICNSLWQDVYNLIKDSYIYVYHFSKVLNISSIYKNGLLVNSVNNYLTTIDPLLDLIINNCIDIKDSIIKEINRKNEFDMPKICFFYPEKLSDAFIGYSNFVGGEILSSIIIHDLPNEYDKLKSIGTSIRVKFKIKILDINTSHVERLIKFIIVQYLFLLYSINDKTGFDSFITKNVPPEDIIEIKHLN